MLFVLFLGLVVSVTANPLFFLKKKMKMKSGSGGDGGEIIG